MPAHHRRYRGWCAGGLTDLPRDVLLSLELDLHGGGYVGDEHRESDLRRVARQQGDNDDDNDDDDSDDDGDDADYTDGGGGVVVGVVVVLALVVVVK
jgi:hypothetical protein